MLSGPETPTAPRPTPCTTTPSRASTWPAGATTELLAPLPEQSLALAVAGDRIYVSSAYGRGLWAFRRRDGRLLATLPVGAAAADLLWSPTG